MNDTLVRAAAYLAKSQHTDGSWADGDPFVCARACAALQACDNQEQAKGIGVSYLEKHAGGGRPLSGEVRHVHGRRLHRLRADGPEPVQLFQGQPAGQPRASCGCWSTRIADGSWSGRNATKNAYTTSLCLRALYTFYLSGLAKYRMGVEHVLEKVEAPGFFDEPVSHVYAPVLNLHRIDQLPGGHGNGFPGICGKARR